MLGNLSADLLTALARADTPAALWSVTADYLDGLGLTHSVYSLVDKRNPGASRLWTSLPDFWRERYADKNYWHVDPYYRYCCTSFAPVRTGPEYLRDYGFLTAPERRVVHEGGETGFRSGFSAPVRLVGGPKFGGWNFGSVMRRREMESFIQAHGDELRLAGFYIHEYAQRLWQSDEARSRLSRLTPRERECLLWLSRGLRTAAIAHRLGIAPVTVDLHFKGARQKLKAATREEALAKAILDDQVEP